MQSGVGRVVDGGRWDGRGDAVGEALVRGVEVRGGSRSVGEAVAPEGLPSRHVRICGGGPAGKVLRSQRDANTEVRGHRSKVGTAVNTHPQAALKSRML